MVAAALGTAGCGGANPRNGPIVAARNGIYLFRPDGSHRRRVPGTTGVGGQVVWSPDAKRLAFEAGSIYVIDREGKHRREVARGGLAPAWSPDGKRLAYMADCCETDTCEAAKANAIELFTVRVDGSDVRRLTEDVGYDGDPAWSPDGNRIAYVSDGGLSVMNADGSGARLLVRRGFVNNPAWSVDGRRIAFDNAVDVFVVNVKTRVVRKLTRNPGPDRNPAWSPDGERIAYLSRAVCGRCYSAETPMQIWTMRADGTRPRSLIRDVGFGPPDWAAR